MRHASIHGYFILDAILYQIRHKVFSMPVLQECHLQLRDPEARLSYRYKGKGIKTLGAECHPSILQSEPRDCILRLVKGFISKGSKQDASRQTYRKKIIITPNIFASSHLFEDTLPQYFNSSR